MVLNYGDVTGPLLTLWFLIGLASNTCNLMFIRISYIHRIQCPKHRRSSFFEPYSRYHLVVAEAKTNTGSINLIFKRKNG